PPASNTITDLLEKEIALNPGSTFRGRVASIIADKGFSEQIAFANQMNSLIENDMQTTGLWLKNIPTLTEYNQIITPAFYRLTRDFLTAPEDRQNRSWTNFSKIDVKILRLLGVRFVLTPDASLLEKKRAHINVPGKGALTLYE